jgi:hypothetical protein
VKNPVGLTRNPNTLSGAEEDSILMVPRFPTVCGYLSVTVNDRWFLRRSVKASTAPIWFPASSKKRNEY